MSHRRAAALVGLALVPLAVVSAFVICYGLDLPIMDQWELVPLFDRVPRFSELAAFHNEHRMLAPRIIMLLLARLTHWDIRWELGACLVLSAGLFVVLVRALALRGLWMAGASVLAFSLVQKENFFFGWSLQIFLNVLGIAGAVALLSRPTAGPRRLLGAAALVTLAHYSFANGVLGWPIGALMLWDRRAPARALAMWLTVGGVATALYFVGYPGRPLVPAQPSQMAGFALGYLGAPVGNFWQPMSVALGGVGVCVLLLLQRRWLRPRSVPG